MAAPDSKVREAALALMIAIGEARAAGYVVQWPRRPEDLPRIAVSATGAVKPEPKPKVKLNYSKPAPAAEVTDPAPETE